MSQILSMLIPFVLTGIIFTIGALAWARRKQKNSDQPEDMTQSTERSVREGER